MARVPGALRWLRAASIVGVVAVTATCTDQTPVTPRRSLAPGHSRMAITPTFQLAPPGAPIVTLSKVRGILVGMHGDSIVVEARFQGDSAILTFDVQFTGNSANYTLDLTGFDIGGAEAYHAVQTYTLKPGDNTDLPQPVLVYSAPDSKVQVLHVVPSSMILNAGAASGLGVTGSGPNNTPIAPIR